MVGLHFSGTGNTKACVNEFLKCCDPNAKSFSITDARATKAIEESDVIVFGYPIYFSNLPKIVRDFILKNSNIFSGKKIFLIATMGLFSGDGTGCSARLLKKCGGKILGGLHLKMPDCIGDEKLLKKTQAENRRIIKEAFEKIANVANLFENGNPPREGLSFWHHLAGLFGQRLWFYGKTKNYCDKPKIDQSKCVLCEKCVALCPMDNLKITNGKVETNKKCTLCYRCFANCPKQAITILGTTVHEQCKFENYTD